MTGVPQIIEVMPEFTTGRQLYNFIFRHFRKIITNPVTVQWFMILMISSRRQ